MQLNGIQGSPRSIFLSQLYAECCLEFQLFRLHVTYPLPHSFNHSFIHSSACAACNNYLPFSGASSIPICRIFSPSTLFHQLVFHPSSLNLAIYFLVYLSALLFPNSYILILGEFYFLPFSVHAQTNVIYSVILPLLSQVF